MNSISDESANKKLELSKSRLASAFSNLEAVIEAKLNSGKSALLELDSLRQKNKALAEENKKTLSDLANIELDYNKIKNYGFEIMEDLESSISSIEVILGTERGNSKHND